MIFIAFKDIIISFEYQNWSFKVLTFLIYIIMMQNRIKDWKQQICISEYSYKQNLLYSSKETRIYRAKKSNTQSTTLVFKEYSEEYLINPQKQNQLQQELKCLSKLKGKQNVVQLITQHFKDHHVYIILQNCQYGSLQQEVKQHGPFDEAKAVAYISQIVNGYRSIFEAKIIHRSLDPSNILNAGIQIKISDFSDAVELSNANLSNKQMMGNKQYQAPQVLQKCHYSVQSDIYSIGAIFYYLLTGARPFQKMNKQEIIKNMKQRCFSKQQQSLFCPKTKQFLAKTLAAKVQERMNIKELLNFSFNLLPNPIQTKLFTFQDSQPQLIDQSYLDKLQIKNKTSIIEEKDKSQGQNLFKNFDASRVDIRISDEGQVSRIFKNRDISIFIPTKLDVNTTLDNIIDKQLFFNDKIKSAQQKSLPQEQITNKLETPGNFCDLLKTQKSSKKKSRNNRLQIQIDKQDQQISPKLNQVKLKASKLPQAKMTQPSKLSKQRFQDFNTSAKKIQVTRQPAPSPFFKQEGIKTNLFNFNDSMSKKKEKMKTEFNLKSNQKNEMTSAWLVSQIYMFRWLNRVIFKLKSHQKEQVSQLYQHLLGLRSDLLENIKTLAFLPQKCLISFRNSPEHQKFLEIVQLYEKKQQNCGKFQGYTILNNHIVDKIYKLFTQIHQSLTFKQAEIRLLDMLITLWQLIKLLKKKDIKLFHQRSKIDLIMDGKEYEVTTAHLFQIYDRMKTFKLIT